MKGSRLKTQMNNYLQISYSRLLQLALSFSIVLSGCSKDDVDSTAVSETDTAAEAIEVTGCSTSTGIAKVICLADAFKAQLSTTQLATVQLSYSKANAIKWSNFPQALVSSAYKRVGLNFGSMSTEQIQYAKALLKEITGTDENEGYSELEQILNADNYLASLNANGGYGSANYYLAFLGTPATTGTFEIQFGGHHLAISNTYTDGVLVGATPSFRGVEPLASFTYNGVTNIPLTQEQTAFINILSSLSTSELATAKLSPTVSDLVAGPQQDDNFPSTYSGIKCSNLTTAQKELVLTAIKTYVNDVAGSESILAKYESELDNTYIAYSGTTALNTRGDYIRIDGPSVWIEWAGQGGVVFNVSHPHSVWRDKLTDYGGN
ncbi:DUF3500 domain-containing protein [Sphingobacterium sp. LRF_L2]|uniref:DUF3500 domain-containing protein n=1 Tax=Sphingobacterium sp. LRF_L2 TaxID=3369421 RepID=UPI003F5EE875